MRILIFHGYLLGGTGSNVYNARLAQALTRLGHEVHLLSQERHPERLSFVDAAGDWDGGALAVRALSDRAARCTVYRPDIGPLLPVYVHDRYEGLEARTFALCSDQEVLRYLEANVKAVREVAALARPQVALANHLVMGPAILARALGDEGVTYAVKVHGSALEYTVKPDPDRFLSFAREGIAGASGVLVGSRHTAESLWAALGRDWVAEHDTVRLTRLGPPGVDVHAFAPREPEQARDGLRALARRLASASRTQGDREQPARGDAFARDDARAAAALARLDPAAGPIVAYVGKLIVSKGVDLLLAAWPLVLRQVPSARLAIVGFGALQQGLEALARDLAAGDLEGIGRFAEAGRALEGGAPGPLAHMRAFLRALEQQGPAPYLKASAALAERALFTGRLDHEELADLLPACSAIVVPSTFPEAFGMVAVEGAACGALPISAAHSGLAEVSDALAAAVPEAVARWLSFRLDGAAVEAIASRLVCWLTASEATRKNAREAIVATVRRLWSWEGVAGGVLAAAEGRVSDLPSPGKLDRQNAMP